jgi:cytosine/adenosine deaminase-related metal-dependent hydrolase
VEYYAGARWSDGEPEEAWVATEAGRLIDEGRGRPPKAATPAILLDGLYNHHTHIGDAFLAGEGLPRDLAELVAPETGLKHRRLASASASALTLGMRKHLEASIRTGVAGLVDFREQGRDGLRLAREASAGLRIEAHLLGRPRSWPPAPGEVEDLLSACDGLGAPSLTDWGREACADLAEACRRSGRAFALHASEGEREPIEDVLALRPDLLVHLGAATRADLRLVADAAVPVVVCPSSNEFFHVPCAADRLAALGIPWYLGTDNAMLGALDPVDEARRLRGRHAELDDAELLRALTTRPTKVINNLTHDADAGRAPRLRLLPLSGSGAIRWDAPSLVVERAP